MSSAEQLKEEARLAALHRYSVLDTVEEDAYDDITALASSLCGKPIALISLVDEHRQWFKSHRGLGARETPREIAFCAHAIEGTEVFEVKDATHDPRFANNPLVAGNPHVRFYAGAPLETPDGHNIGTLCVVDHEPGELTQAQREDLARLARTVINLLELRLSREEALERAREVRDLYDGAPCGHHSLDERGIFVAINATELGWLGYDPSEVVGSMKFTDLLTEAGQKTFEESFPRFKAEGHIEHLEFELRRKDGSLFPVLLSATAVFDEEGAFFQSRSTIVDITEQVRLRAERDRVFDTSPDMLCTASLEGYFLDLNPAFERTLGWNGHELLSQPFLDFVHPDDRASTLAELEHLGEGQRTLHFHNRYQCKDGTWRNLSWNATPDPDKGIVYAAARDETDILAAREALRASEQQHRVTLRSLGDAVIATDAEGRITLLNPVAEALTGWSEPEALGRPAAEVFDIVHEETRKPALSPIDDVLASGTPHELANHTALIARDGTERSIEDSAAPLLDPQGNLTGVVLVFRDVTETRAARKALRLREEQYRLALEASDLSTFDWDMATGDFRVDANFRRFLGRGLERVDDVEKTAQDYIWPDDVQTLLAMLDAINDGTSERLDVEIRVRRADNTPLWVRVLAKVMRRGASGAPARMLGTLQSVEQRRSMEAELRSLAERMTTMVSASGAVLYTHAATPPFGTTYVSPSAKDVLGFDPEACMRPGFWEGQTHPEDLPRLVEEALTLFKKGAHVFEYRLRDADGRWRWMLNHARIRCDGDEQPAEIVVAMMDITEHREIRDDLQRFKEALDQLDDAVIMALPDDLQITYVNSGFAKQVGYTREELLAMRLPEIAATPDERYRAAMHQLATEGSMRVEGLHRHKSGRVVPVDITAQLVEPSAAAPVCVAIARDITERMRVEEEREADLRLQRAIAEISTRLLESGEPDIGGALGILGRALGMDRAYVDRVAEDKASRTHEWCAPGVAEHQSRVQSIPMSSFGVLRPAIAGTDPFVVADATMLPPEAAEERKILEAFGIRTLAIVPFEATGSSSNVLGLTASEPRDWTDSELNLLRIAADSLSAARSRAMADAALAELNRTLEARVRERTRALHEAEQAGGVGSFEFDLQSGGVTWTEGLYAMYGRDPTSFTPTYEGFLEHIHPDDRDHLAKETNAAIERGGRYGHTKRIVRADGETRLLETRAEVVADAQGQPSRVVGMCSDITERHKAEKRFEDLFEFAPDAIIMTRADGVVQKINRQAEALFGYEREELVGQAVEMLIPEASREHHVRLREGFASAPTVRAMGAGQRQLLGRRKGGADFPIDISLGPLETSDGLLIAAAVRDASERVRAEAIMQQALREKETLLKEIHHRVKNNLQIISSLLALQADECTLEETRESFAESIQRVRSMALIHERLYQSDTLARVDFGEYARTLAISLFRSYQTGASIELELETAPVELNIETAVPLGLVLNELVSNAFKHAFPSGAGRLHIRVRPETEGFSLTVSDTGVGLPPDYDPENATSMGMTLIHTLIRQLKARLVIETASGTSFRIDFKELTYATR